VVKPMERDSSAIRNPTPALLILFGPRRMPFVGLTAKAKLAAVLLDPKPLAALLALPDGITVVPLALPLSSYVLHGAFHRRPCYALANC